LSSLSAEVTSARNVYRQAMKKFDDHKAMCRGLSKGHSDRLTTADLEERVKVSGEKYWEALRIYTLAVRKYGGQAAGETEA